MSRDKEYSAQMSHADDNKIAEQAFAGSLAIIAVLIAVVGLVGTAADKVSGISYLLPRFEFLQRSIAGLSVFAAIVALVSLQRLRGTAIPGGLIAWLLRLLIVGTALVTVAFVLIW
jgi:hypothetical protein